MQVSVLAAVIRDYSLDDDRILLLLTKEHGLITAYAKGAKKPSGKMAAATELFSYSRFTLFHYKDRYSINNAELEKSFLRLRSDILGLALASYICEITAELAPKEQPAEEFFRLFLNTLHFINEGNQDFNLLKAIYELRIMTLSGFMPDLVGCRGCACFAHEEIYFLPALGELVCADCLDKQDGERFLLPEGVLAAMRHIVYSEFVKLFAFRFSEEGARYLSAISESYLQYHLEKRLKCLDFYKSLC